MSLLEDDSTSRDMVSYFNLQSLPLGMEMSSTNKNSKNDESKRFKRKKENRRIHNQFRWRWKNKFTHVLKKEALRVAPIQQPKVLCDYEASDNLIAAMALGRKWIRTPRTIDFNQLHIGLHNFKRATRIYYFWNNPIINVNGKTVTERDLPRKDEEERKMFSDFRVNTIREGVLNPFFPKSCNNNLESFLSEVELAYITAAQERQRNWKYVSNIDENQLKAVDNFNAEEDIIARSEDKGSTFAIWQKGEYERAVLNMSINV